MLMLCCVGQKAPWRPAKRRVAKDVESAWKEREKNAKRTAAGREAETGKPRERDGEGEKTRNAIARQRLVINIAMTMAHYGERRRVIK
ncbi:hypothetical protein [Achromobacter sp. AGC39]